MKQVKQLELSEELIKHGILEIYYDSDKIEIHYTGLDRNADTITIPVLKYAHDTINQLDTLINGSMSLDAFTHLKWYLSLQFSPIWDRIYVSATASSDNRESELLDQRVTKQDIDFVIDTIAKEAKHDRTSIKQLFHGYNSGLTKTVIHGNVNSKNAGAGKSYLLNKVSEYYPDEHVLILTGASDKAFQHKEGIMILEDKKTGELTEVEPIINNLRMNIVDLEQKLENEKSKAKDKKNKQVIKELKEQILEKEQEIKGVLEKQIKLIILSDTIILLLDTPQDALTDNLMSILSNDTTRDQKYLFTAKDASGKQIAKYNILRGTPVLFTTMVIDDSRSVRFEEKNRRFVNITPNVSTEKIEDANSLMWQECGLTPEEYDGSVVSREDKEKAKRIVSILVEKLKNHTKYLKPKEFGIKIPFIKAIKIPSNDIWSMTVNDRMRRYLSIITKENMDSRPRLVRKDNSNIFLPISTFEDLKKTLELMQRGGSNIRPYIAEWYNQVFLPAFESEDGIVRSRIENIGEKSEKTLVENYVAVTSKQLRDKTKEVKGVSISSDELRQKFTDPLVNLGIIEKTKSEIRKSENIYFPVDETGQNIFSLFSNEDHRLIVKPSLYPTKEVIVSAFSRHFENQAQIKHRDKQGGILEKNILDIYKLIDCDGLEITPEDLADKVLFRSKYMFYN